MGDALSVTVCERVDTHGDLEYKLCESGENLGKGTKKWPEGQNYASHFSCLGTLTPNVSRSRAEAMDNCRNRLGPSLIFSLSKWLHGTREMAKRASVALVLFTSIRIWQSNSVSLRFVSQAVGDQIWFRLLVTKLPSLVRLFQGVEQQVQKLGTGFLLNVLHQWYHNHVHSTSISKLNRIAVANNL